MTERFFAWLGENAITGTIAIGTIGVASYLTIAGSEVPEWLVGIIGAIVGFYFSDEARKRAQT